MICYSFSVSAESGQAERICTITDYKSPNILPDSTKKKPFYYSLFTFKWKRKDSTSLNDSIVQKNVKNKVVHGANTYTSKYLKEFRKDTALRKKSPITIHGTAGVNTYYSSYTYPGQTMPTSYVRWQFTPQISVFGIPFHANVFLSTEQKQLKNMDAISFGFDFQRFQQTMKQRAQREAEQSYNLVEKKKDDEEAMMMKEYEHLGKELNSEKTKEEMVTQKAILAEEPKMDTFSRQQNAFSLNKAHAFLKQYEDKIKRLDSIKPLYEQANENRIKAKFHAINTAEKNELGTAGMAKRVGLPESYEPYIRLLYSIRSFNIGTCYPIYSPLTIQGVGLKGMDIALNPGKYYFQVSGGNATSANSYVVSDGVYQSSKRRIYAARVGYGKAESALFTVAAVYGEDLNNLPNGYTPVLRFRNAVLSTQTEINLKDRVNVSGELAKSYLAPVGGGTEVSTGASSISQLRTNNQAGTVAYNMKAKTILPVTKTRVTAFYRNTGANYTSFGIPFLRKDLVQYEGRAEQDFFHKKITTAAFMKQEEDNQLNLKAFQTINTYYGASTTLKLKKLPVIQISYAPTYQKRVSTYGNKDSLLFGTNLLTTSLNYTITIDKALFSSMAAYTQSQVQSMLVNYTSRIYTFNQLINIEKIYTISFTGMYVSPIERVGNPGMYSYEVALAKTQKNKLTLKGGYALRNRAGIGRQEGLFGVIASPINKYGSIQLRVDGFTAMNSLNTTEQKLARYYYSSLCSLLVHW